MTRTTPNPKGISAILINVHGGNLPHLFLLSRGVNANKESHNQFPFRALPSVFLPVGVPDRLMRDGHADTGFLITPEIGHHLLMRRMPGIPRVVRFEMPLNELFLRIISGEAGYTLRAKATFSPKKHNIYPFRP